MLNEVNFSEDVKTEWIAEEVSKCESIEELKAAIFPMLLSQKEIWANKAKDIIKEAGISQEKLANLCGVSRQSVNNWTKGSLPKNRETLLRIGMAAGYSQEQLNQLLTRYGGYPALYSKSLEDCVCIYIISHYQGEEAVEKYQFIIDKIKESIERDDDIETVDNITTKKFDEKLSKVQDQDELEKFIEENIAMFSNAYHKFYAYVMAAILATVELEKREVSATTSIAGLADGQGWSSSLKQSVSAIRQGKWYPTRNKIILLGLHLCMDHEQIDTMLELAHMEPLCAKNIFESVIIFILEDASLNDIMNTDDIDYSTDGLYEYARTVFDSLDFPEIDKYYAE